MRCSWRKGLTSLLLAAPLAANAQDDGWRFAVQPYVLLPTMQGTAGLRQFDADVAVGTRDVIDNLNTGYLGYLEAAHGRWAFGLDVNYMNLDAAPDRPRIQADVGQKAVQSMVFYRLGDSLELLGGVRYNRIRLRLSTSLQVADGLSREEDWIDPIFGVRYTLPLSGRSAFIVLANAGGFGVASDLAVQVRPMFHFGVGRFTTIDAGYQFFYMDYEDGSGSERFAYDVWTTGPVIGLTFRF